jgi:hypothetical protein
MADHAATVSVRSFGRRRAVVAVVSIAIAAILAFGAGHAGAHSLQNLIVPGIGLYETSLLLAVAVFVLTIAAIVAWAQWGLDWLAAGVVITSTVASFVLTDSHHHPVSAASTGLPPVAAAHEFPLVVLVVSAIVWVRGAIGRMPGLRRLTTRRARRLPDASFAALTPVDRSRAAAIAALVDPADVHAVAAATDPAVERRARRVGRFARCRRGAYPFAVDHAGARAALALTAGFDDAARLRFLTDAERSAAGVPASEPTWVRPLDATLAAIALEACGQGQAASRWQAMLHGPLALRRGHRPACWWTPLGVRIGAAAPWEHATFTALARSRGWIGDDDWAALRSSVLGAAARGSAVALDERTIAAGRLWLVFVDDEQAARILARPTVHRDALAVALDRLATTLAAERKDLAA